MNPDLNNAPYLSANTKSAASLVDQLKTNELYWLSGYCAALANERSANTSLPSTTLSLVKSQQTKPAEALKTAVLYASQTGNSQKIAEALFEKLNDDSLGLTHIKSELISFADFNFKQIQNYAILLIVTSTHGEGEPPDDAIEFFDYMDSGRAPKLNNTQHAILGLGDSSYEFFCQTAKDFEQQLTQQGSISLVERVDCDIDYQAQSTDWINQVIQSLSNLADSENDVILQNSAGLTNDALAISDQTTAGYSKAHPLKAKVLLNQPITGKGSDKQIHHIELSLEDADLSFSPGDSLGVWAKNDAQLVDEILKQTGLSGDETVLIGGQNKNLKQALINDLELTLLNKDFILKYATLTHSAELKQMADESYKQTIASHQVVDLLLLAPAQLEAQQLVDLLKPIKPRMYSIASSLDANPGEVHLTVGLVTTENNQATRYGTASRFLNQTLSSGDEVSIFVEANKHFKLPEAETPIIMIGPGTGIAPFRAFLQQRHAEQASGENWLFFGNPHFNTDFLYQTELQDYLKKGLLTRLSLAFSRDQEEKIYVQQRLTEEAETIWHWIENKQANIYICGDMSRMAKDVEAALIDIFRSQGNLTQEQANSFLKQLKKNHRYQRDVY